MLKTTKVATGDLAIGMYVSGLDRPWLESPFAVQGFYVHNEADILEVAETCSFVFVDPRRPIEGERGEEIRRGRQCLNRLTVGAEEGECLLHSATPTLHPRRQTLNEAPQPQLRDTLGLLRLKPDCIRSSL